MIVYYYKKGWWDRPPYEKKAQKLDLDLAKPAFRPGQWIMFTDPTLCPDIGYMCGKIDYVVYRETDGKKSVRYEVQHGYTMHDVGKKQIQCVMVPENEDETD